MQFDYLYEVQATGSIEIENIGNVILNAVNTLFNEEYFLVIQTDYGKTRVAQYGPLFVDQQTLPSFINANFQEFDYSSHKIENIIEKFLNNPKYHISQVQEVDIETAKERLEELVNYI